MELRQSYFINISLKKTVLPGPLTLVDFKRAQNYLPLWIFLLKEGNKLMIPGTLDSTHTCIKLKYGLHWPLSEVEVVDENLSQETIIIDNVIDSLQ